MNYLKSNLISDLTDLINKYDGSSELYFKSNVNSLIDKFVKIVREDKDEESNSSLISDDYQSSSDLTNIIDNISDSDSDDNSDFSGDGGSFGGAGSSGDW